MLRRKLLIVLGSLVALLLVVAIAAIWLLQGVLTDFDHTGTRDARLASDATQMGSLISQIEIELREIQLGRERHLDNLVDDSEQLKAVSQSFGAAYTSSLPEGKNLFDRVTATLPVFERHVAMLATSQDKDLASAHTTEAMTASVQLRRDILQLSQMMRDHIAREEREAIAWFRWLVLALAIVFLLMINVAVMVLLRTANMILRPVDQLVEASRRLANEEFDFRVRVNQDNEFGELARAYNHLAEQLQANEARKLETLAQTAVMLNHELNNASAIIKLQLQLLTRQSMGNPVFEKSLRQIETSLARMTSVLSALKQVRRIVLTDYAPDVKMLDLEKSVSTPADDIHPLSDRRTA